MKILSGLPNISYVLKDSNVLQIHLILYYLLLKITLEDIIVLMFNSSLDLKILCNSNLVSANRIY